MQHVKHTQFKFPQAGGIYPESQRSFIVLGPSGVGKTSAMISLLTGPMKGLHTRIWIVSPSAKQGTDPLWDSYREWIKKHTDWADEETIFDHYDEETLTDLVETHGRVNAALKKAGRKKLHSACLLLDDLADSPEFHNNRNLIAKIFLKGRHMGVSCCCLSQRYRALSTVVRSQACYLLVFRMRNRKELDALLDELSGVCPRKTLEQFYEEATAEKHSFLYINLMADRCEDMFYKNFEYRLLP